MLKSPSSRYLLRRLGQAVLVLAIVVVLQFFLLQLAPGDVADVIAGEAQASDPEFVRRLRLSWALIGRFGFSWDCIYNGWSPLIWGRRIRLMPLFLT